MLLLYTPWKHLKTFRFSDAFRGYRKETPGCNWLRFQFVAGNELRKTSYTSATNYFIKWKLILVSKRHQKQQVGKRIAGKYLLLKHLIHLLEKNYKIKYAASLAWFLLPYFMILSKSYQHWTVSIRLSDFSGNTVWKILASKVFWFDLSCLPLVLFLHMYWVNNCCFWKITIFFCFHALFLFLKE